MSHINVLATEKLAIVGAIDPATVANTEVFTDVVDVSKFHQVLGIALLGNNCFEVSSGEAAVIVKNLCSQPCCGPEDLVKLTEVAESLWAKSTTLENFLVTLEARSTATDMIFLGSRLGDRTCQPDCG